MKLLACNAGSTSLKFRLYDMPEEREIISGKLEKIGSDEAIVSYKYGDKKGRSVRPVKSFLEGTAIVMSILSEQGAIQCQDDISGIAFKTVHGGRLTKTSIVDDDVLALLDEYRIVAPLHNKVYAEVIRAFRETTKCPLVAVFETAFHQNMPEYAKRYSVPYEWLEKYGIQRYGFHGASHGYISTRIRQIMGVKDPEGFNVISCHLGGSSSICPIKGGVSMGATQGFSPQSGITMSARVGDIDAYVPIYLMKKGMTLEQLNDALYNNSGFIGISGVSEDVRELEEAEAKGNERAALALDMYCYDVKRYIGQSLAILGRADAIVITGGIGENGVNVRERILTDMEHLGIILDKDRNAANVPEAMISTDDSPISVYMVPTNEEIMVVREAYKAITAK